MPVPFVDTVYSAYRADSDLTTTSWTWSGQATGQDYCDVEFA